MPRGKKKKYKRKEKSTHYYINSFSLSLSHSPGETNEDEFDSYGFLSLPLSLSRSHISFEIWAIAAGTVLLSAHFLPPLFPLQVFMRCNPRSFSLSPFSLSVKYSRRTGGERERERKSQEREIQLESDKVLLCNVALSPQPQVLFSVPLPRFSYPVGLKLCRWCGSLFFASMKKTYKGDNAIVSDTSSFVLRTKTAFAFSRARCQFGGPRSSHQYFLHLSSKVYKSMTKTHSLRRK